MDNSHHGHSDILRWVMIGLGVAGIIAASIAALYVTGTALEQATKNVTKRTDGGERVIIGLDISQGSPLIADSRFDDVAADVLFDRIRILPIKSEVIVASIGDFGMRQELLNFRKEITRRQPATEVARFVATIVRGMPTSLERGMIVANERTNILAVLEDLAQSVDCEAAPEAVEGEEVEHHKTTVYLFSDGIEDSEFVVLDSTEKQLPSPEPGLFEHCDELQIIGLGASQSNPVITRHLRSEWERWSKEAGFASFRGFTTLRR